MEPKYLKLKLLILITFSLVQFSSAISIDISEILDVIDIFPSCVNAILLQNTNNTNDNNAELNFTNDYYPIVLTELSANSENKSLICLNLVKITEGCRLLLDFSFEHYIQHLQTNREERIKAVVYEVRVSSNSEVNDDDNENYADHLSLPHAVIFWNNRKFSEITYFISCDKNLSKTGEKSLIQSPSNIIHLCAHKSNGQGKLAYFDSDASLQTEKLGYNTSTCEKNTFLSTISVRRCTATTIFFQILSDRLNISYNLTQTRIDSFAEESDLDMLEPNPSLVICITACLMEPEYLLGGRASVVNFAEELQYALYCKNDHTYENPSWLVILEPFDHYIWICLVIIALICALLYRNVKYGFDVFFLLLCQSSQVKWNRWVGLLMLILQVLNQYYQGEETTKVTAPLEKEHIISVIKLFENGFNFVMPNQEVAAYGHKLVEDRYKKLGVPGDTIHPVINYRVDITKGIHWTWFWYLALYKWIIPIGQTQIGALMESGIFKQNRLLNVSCYVVRDEKAEDDQHLFIKNSLYFVRGALETKAYLTLRRMYESGIYLMWNGNVNRQEIRYAGLRDTCKDGGSCHDANPYKPLSIHSPVIIVIYWHLLICILALLAFIFEMRKVIAQFFLFREPRKFLLVIQISDPISKSTTPSDQINQAH